MEQAIVPMESNATAIYQRLSDPMVAIKEMGQMFAASGMFGCSKVEQGQVLALACLIEGKSPFELMRNFHIINGSLSMRASAILAEFLKKGGKCEWHSALNDAGEAKATFSLGDNKLNEATYSIDDAKREGLVEGPNKHNWKVRSPDMLRARLITKAIRMIAPGIVMGIMEESEATERPSEPLLPPTEVRIEPAEALEDLLKADGLDPKDAIAFLITRKRLEPNKTLNDLAPAAREKIVKNYSDFAAKVREFKGETNG